MKAESNCIVIFGASGDLTRRKLIPAMYTLYREGRLPSSFAVLGIGRSPFSDQEFRDRMQEALSQYAHREHFCELESRSFCSRLYYQSIDTKNPAEYGIVKARLAEIDRGEGTSGNYLFYLSTPPSLYSLIPPALASVGLNRQEEGWRRLVVEKPFGHDLASARSLNTLLRRDFEEEQIYRIDHYLGKETVQNLLVFRFSNAIFEPIWNRSYIDYVEVTSSEQIGVEKRGGYYDGAGAVSDMLQNHLLQVLAFTAMEPPAAIDAESIRNEIGKVLQCLRPLDREGLEKQVVLGQYEKARVDNKVLPSYREEDGVRPDSLTETYAAMKVQIDNWRWNGVPFYIRTGKRLPEKITEVAIHFKKTPHPVFGVNPPENRLLIRIQPNEGLVIHFGLKEPGSGFRSKDAGMSFRYADMADSYILSAYERLLLDCMIGDQTLYLRSDIVEKSWRYVEPILSRRGDLLHPYPSGSWGPEEAEKLLIRDQRRWRDPCKKKNEEGTCEL